MENQNNHQPKQDDSWFDDLLPSSKQEDLGLDESAIYDKGLIHPADIELEKIIQEAKAMDLAEEMEVTNLQPPMTDTIPYAEIDDSQIPVAELKSDMFEYLPAEDESQPEEQPQDDSVKKGRPRRAKGYGLFGIPHILSTLVWVFIVFATGLSLGRLIWVCAADVLAFGKSPKEAVIIINQQDDLDDIAKKLERAGLIEYPDLFVLYMDFSGNDEIEVGTHHLSSMIYDYHAIKTALAPKATARDTVEVVIPEGYNCSQIFKLLEDKGVCSVAELEEYAANGDLNEYWFLEGVERGDKYCLEGYLFPDTYQFYKGHDPELVLEKMLDNFDYRFTDIMKEKIQTLNETLASKLSARGYSNDFIEARKFTIREVVIVASMIERETASGTESYDIASVIYNRLTNPANYPYLNIDATVLYGMGGPKTDPVTGESLPLTYEDLANDTPYNSYTRKGLIPGPISNPGRNSINAALDPNNTDYYYYVFDPSAGRHIFATTEQQHEQNKANVSK